MLIHQDIRVNPRGTHTQFNKVTPDVLFHTSTFFIFFAIFIALYFATHKLLTVQNLLVLIGSYVFYAAWDERFLVLIMASTATDYIAGLGAAGRQITRKTALKTAAFLLTGCAVALGYTFSSSWHFFAAVVLFVICGAAALRYASTLQVKSRRKFWMIISLIVNLGLLAIFKYFNFFADSLATLAGGAGLELTWVTLSIALPVGISFYTFQTLSYTIDIYRDRMEPTEKLMELAAYIAFFPQLVAGPIERARNLLPQFFKRREITFDRITSGMILFAWGMYKKAVIADNLSIIANDAFANPDAMSSGGLWLGLLAFTFQIYCDFSGYSDMARGIARIMGFDLMVNFRLPYFSRTPSEFWRGWHISLSSWLRDYLYIGLGGNRGGGLLTYRNLFLTMLLGGLWHGAAWTFVLWGAYQGSVLVVYRIAHIDQWLAKPLAPVFELTRSAITMGIFFFLTMIGWLIFRANGLDNLSTYFDGLFAMRAIGDIGSISTVLKFIVPLIIVQILQAHYKKLEFQSDVTPFLRYNMYLFVLFSIVALTYQGEVEFIYFDF